jgi:hypothetical protein
LMPAPCFPWSAGTSRRHAPREVLRLLARPARC